MQEQGKKMALVRSLLAGITAGVLAGSTLGVVFVLANRYLADGQPQLALASLRDFVNRYALRVGLFFLQIEITYLLLSYALGRRWKNARAAHGANAALWIFGITAVALWWLRVAPWTPRVLSREGIPLFGGVALVGVCAGRFVARHGERLRSGVSAALRGFSGAKPAGAALALLAGVNAGAAALASHETRTGPNILLITIDALRADHLGAYGYARPTSPNIDRLASEGVRFQRAVSQWPLTSPSFASMMSSTYGHTNGLIRTTAQRMPDRSLMLAELLQGGGLHTSAVVGNVNLARVFNFDQGFEIYREALAGGRRAAEGADDAQRPRPAGQGCGRAPLLPLAAVSGSPRALPAAQALRRHVRQRRALRRPVAGAAAEPEALGHRWDRQQRQSRTRGSRRLLRRAVRRRDPLGGQPGGDPDACLEGAGARRPDAGRSSRRTTARVWGITTISSSTGVSRTTIAFTFP